MPLTARSVAYNILPKALRTLETVNTPLTAHDLVKISGGHDFLLQASNEMCAAVAFKSLQMPWLVSQLDPVAVANLRWTLETLRSPALRAAVTALLGSSASELLFLFSQHDILFDGDNKCRIRLRVRLALGNSLVMPKEPGLGRSLVPGEAVQRISPIRFENRVAEMSPALLGAMTPGTPPPVMRTFGGDGFMGLTTRDQFEIDPAISFRALDRRIDLGAQGTFDVSAWLGEAVLEIPATFAATGDPISKTIKVTADLHQTSAQFTEATEDAAILLSSSDPLGIAQTITFRLRQRGSVPLIRDVSLVGVANAKAGHLGGMTADVFPTRGGASSLNVAATIAAGHVPVRTANHFIGSSSYGVVWSDDAVRLLVRYCWETGAFPRGIVQTQTVRIKFEDVDQDAEAISVFQLEELTDIQLEFDSNGGSDVLYTNGSARVVPKFIRLRDGRELLPKNENDEAFKPSKNMRWSAFGALTEDPIFASAPDLYTWLKAMTNGVTSRLGRPFTEPDNAVVTASRLSAPQRRIALLVD
jgi:hypothetical protein